MRLEPLLLLACLGSAAACSSNQPTVTVVHRCGDVNFAELNGTFGRIQGENNINPKFRVKFTTEGGVITGQFVLGGFERFEMVGTPAGFEQMTFRQTGGDRFVKAGLDDDCRFTAAVGRTQGGSEVMDPGEPLRFAPFAELKNYDFEPCTETLFIKAGAQRKVRAKPPKPGEIPVVRSSSMPIGAWSQNADFPAGCEKIFDVYLDGEADAYNVATVELKGDDLNWGMDLDNSYLGVHGIALHRFAKCDGERRLLGVACREVEVK
jgi:hypothetical protein